MIKPLISIAICTYNGEKYLIEQLDSIVNQTYPNLDIVVVDDCSTDGTINILNSYSAKHSNFKVYQNEINLGYIKNFEKAIGLCKGEFIALSDQDDIWDLNKIYILLSEIGDNLLIYHDSEFVDESGRSVNKKLSDLFFMYHGNSFKPFLFFNCVSGHAILFNKKLYGYSAPFPTEIFHDRWLAYVAVNIGSIKYIDKALVKYRQHANSDTNILKIKRSKKQKEILGKERIHKNLQELKILQNFKLNKNQFFIDSLIQKYTTKLNSILCMGLVIFMFKNYKNLLKISNKPTLSKLNFVFKHIWGAKLKSD